VLIKGKTQILFGGMGHLSENTVLNLKNKSQAVTAEIEVPQSGAAEAGWSVSPAVMRRVTRQHL
jgi:hypothetical protein